MANEIIKRSNTVKKLIYSTLCFLFLVALSACGGGLKDGDSVYFKGVPQLTVKSHKGGNEQKNCFTCHPSFAEKHKYNPALEKSFSSLKDTDTGVCLYCHGNNIAQTEISLESYKCTFCHANPKIVASASLFNGHMQAHAFNGSGKLNNKDCMTCHAFSNMNGKTEYAIDFTDSGTTFQNTTEVCLYCHDSGGAFGILPSTETTNIYDTYKGLGEQAITADIHGAKDGKGQSFGQFRPDSTYKQGMEVPCLACHEVHSSTNTYMITRFGDSAVEADETARNAEVSVQSNNFAQLCALCHYTPGGATTGNGLTEVTHGSEYDSDCTKCHYHGAGYGDKTDLF